MTTTFLFDEYASAIRDHAATLNGQAVSVSLSGGQTLAGTLTYAAVADTTSYPSGMTVWPKTLTVTVASKVHKVRLDHVSAIGQG
ncbi:MULTISPECIES: hypothetical protein [unclassified Streptomyces]|uniref:hypothetical protein n=1 Tax=unclassified Streptomyces TaxID=2593676 RepID=UPI00344AB70B